MSISSLNQSPLLIAGVRSLESLERPRIDRTYHPMERIGVETKSTRQNQTNTFRPLSAMPRRMRIPESLGRVSWRPRSASRCPCGSSVGTAGSQRRPCTHFLALTATVVETSSSRDHCSNTHSSDTILSSRRSALSFPSALAMRSPPRTPPRRRSRGSRSCSAKRAGPRGR